MHLFFLISNGILVFNITISTNLRWKEGTFLHPLGILVVLMFLIALNGVDCPLNFYGPSMFAEFGWLHQHLLICLLVVKDVVFHLAVMIRSSHLFQVYTFTAIACMRYTSRTAWRLCYSPPNYDGKLLSCFFTTIAHPPPLKSSHHTYSTFHHLSSQKISKKLQYIGATLFMAASLGILSLSYWAQVILKKLFHR